MRKFIAKTTYEQAEVTIFRPKPDRDLVVFKLVQAIGHILSSFKDVQSITSAAFEDVREVLSKVKVDTFFKGIMDSKQVPDVDYVGFPAISSDDLGSDYAGPPFLIKGFMFKSGANTRIHSHNYACMGLNGLGSTRETVYERQPGQEGVWGPQPVKVKEKEATQMQDGATHFDDVVHLGAGTVIHGVEASTDAWRIHVYFGTTGDPNSPQLYSLDSGLDVNDVVS